MFCHSSTWGRLFWGLCSCTMTKSTRWVRVWSCWACNLTHRRDRSVMEGEREETESVREVSRWAIGCWAVYHHSPPEQSRVWHSLCLILKLLFFCFCFSLSPCKCCRRFTVCFLLVEPWIRFCYLSGWLTLVTFKRSHPFLFPVSCFSSLHLSAQHF